METAEAATVATVAETGVPTTSTSTSTTATSSKGKKRNLDDILKTFSEQMNRMDMIEERMKHRCQASRRRILQLLEQQYQQQLYGIDSSNSSSMNTSTIGGTGVSTGAGSSSSTDPATISAFPTTALESSSNNNNNGANNSTPLVSTLPYTRNSHVRMYIHHSYQPQVTAAGAMAALMQKQQHTTTTTTASQRLCKPSPPMWTLHIEGKLLIDHLDYQSAQIRDYANRKRNEPRSSSNSSSNKVTEADPFDKLCSNVPLKFTHFFNKVAVTFQTIYVLIDPKIKSPTASTKNSGKKSRRHVQNDNAPPPPSSGHNNNTSTLLDETKESHSGRMHQVNSGDNEYKSKIQQVIWTLQQDDDVHKQKNATAGGSGTTDPTKNAGADMWSFSYTEPIVTPEFKLKYKVHSVVAVLELYRRYNYYNTSNADTTTATATTTTTTATTTTTRYYRIVSSVLQKSLFPHHGPVTNDILTGSAPIHHHATSSKNILDQLLSSTHNQVHIPLVLTIHEIIQTFFVYIQDHHLIIPNDDGKTNGDVVQCDTTLQQLLNMEQFSFSQLRTLLHQRQLIEPVMNHNGHHSPSPVYDPVRITYIMEQGAASTSLVPTLATKTPPPPSVGNAPDDNSNLSCLQFDMDIYVPHYMMYRLYEILQRLKLREQEYASCRMKGRLRLQSTLPSYTHDGTSSTNSSSNNTATNNMSAQARRLAQQAALTARDDEERHVRNCIDAWIQQRQQQQSSMDDTDGNESSSSSPTSSSAGKYGNVVDMIPFVPLTLAQCAAANSEAQQVYQIDTRIEYLLQQLDSPASTLISNIQEIRTMLNHMLS